MHRPKPAAAMGMHVLKMTSYDKDERSMFMSEVNVSVKLPKELLKLTRQEERELPGQLRTVYVIELVREGRLPFGKAAEILKMNKAEFLALCSAHKVSVFQFTDEELKEELRPL